MSIFMLASLGSSPVTRMKAGRHFVPEIGLSIEEIVEGRRVEFGADLQLESHHDPVPDRVIRYRVDGQRPDVGMTGDDRLDRRGGEVLAIDPEPFIGSPREVEPAVGVPVGEVARPVPTLAKALLRRLLVLVVALEPRRRLRFDDLADGLLQVVRPPVGAERDRRALLVGVAGRAPSRSIRPSRAHRTASRDPCG